MKKSFYFLFFLGITGIISPLFAQEQVCSGTLFMDLNLNGTQDHTEFGIEGIPVSNGRDVVLTDKNGHYQLSVKPSMNVFPILPASYRVTKSLLSTALLPTFQCANKTAKNTDINFPLILRPVYNHWQLAAIGDPQTRTDLEAHYAELSIYDELANRDDIDLHLFLGDLVSDNMMLLARAKNYIQQLPTPSLVAMGNHDRYYNGEFQWQDSVFNAQFGASTFAYNQGFTHIVVFNNVSPTKDKAYQGAYSSDQLQFLRNDLKHVQKDELLIIAQHIPLFETVNADSLLEICKAFKHILILSAHTHNVSRKISDTPEQTIQEITVGTACGHFWRGELNWKGVPCGMMPCGAPRCYFTLDINENRYQMHFKGVGLPESEQINIYHNVVLPDLKPDKKRLPLLQEKEIPELTVYPSNSIIATVFAGCDSTNVSIQIDDEPQQQMIHTKAIAPQVARMRYFEKKAGYPTHFATALKYNQTPSWLVWVYTPSKPFTTGVHSITVRASDKYGYSITQKRLITQ